jgi:hypothetical protein
MIIHPTATATATILPEQENMASHLRPGSNTNVTHILTKGVWGQATAHPSPSKDSVFLISSVFFPKS